MKSSKILHHFLNEKFNVTAPFSKGKVPNPCTISEVKVPNQCTKFSL